MKKEIDPQLFSLSAVIIGYILVGDFKASESNAIGNWLMLVGQYLETFSAQQSNIESKIENRNININSKSAKNGGNIYDNNISSEKSLELLEEALNRMQKEINKIKLKGGL